MTALLRADLALGSDDVLGEGPVWDSSTERLIRVDIARGLVHAWSPLTGTTQTTDAGGRVSLAIPTVDGGLVLAVQDRIVRVGESGTTTLCSVEEDRPTTHLNDGVCDLRGRLWVGTYSLRGEAEGGLYCVEPSGRVHPVLGGLVACNGLGWTPDGAHLYVTDTGRRRVSRFRVDLDGPALTDEQVFCEPSAEEAPPDGIATDVDGGVWVALFGGGVVRRYTEQGTVDAQCRLPASYTTSVAFGGRERDVLYVTTARHRLTTEEQSREPLAGGVFAIAAGRRGVETPVFGRPPR